MEWKWEVISMDFIIGLPRTSKQHDAIMVAIDKLSKVSHFVVVKSTNSSSEVLQVFVKEIVTLHGVPKKFISNRDAKFTSKFWKELFVGLGTKMAFSTVTTPSHIYPISPICQGKHETKSYYDINNLQDLVMEVGPKTGTYWPQIDILQGLPETQGPNNHPRWPSPDLNCFFSDLTP